MDRQNPHTDEIRLAIRKELADHPVLQALSQLLVEADVVTRKKGLHRNTISQNKNVDKYNAVGKRKLLMRLEDVSVLKNRKRGKK